MYDIELVIDGKKKKFERNYPPTLANITDAMKIQRIEIEMVNSGKSFYTDEQLDEREKRIADFAVRFWKNQFTAEDVLNGADLKTVNVINKAVEDALGVERTEESDEKKVKKITVKDVDKTIQDIHDFYKARMQEGYKFHEVDEFTWDDLDRLEEIYKPKKQYIDEVFPFLF